MVILALSPPSSSLLAVVDSQSQRSSLAVGQEADRKGESHQNGTTPVERGTTRVTHGYNATIIKKHKHH